MGLSRIWITIEPAPDADRRAIAEDLEPEKYSFDRANHNGALILHGGSRETTLEGLASTEARRSIDRAASVFYHSSTGTTTGVYYEAEDGSLEECDRIELYSLEEHIFDYFAREYGIHVPV
jgi:hypothetical protein